MENVKLLKTWSNRRFLIIGCMIAGLLAGMASSAFAKGNQVFFRGGGAFLSADRGGQVFTDTGGATGTFNNEDSGFYVGGGVELVLSNNVWGFLPKKPAYWVRSEWSTDASTRTESFRRLQHF